MDDTNAGSGDRVGAVECMVLLSWVTDVEGIGGREEKAEEATWMALES